MRYTIMLLKIVIMTLLEINKQIGVLSSAFFALSILLKYKKLLVELKNILFVNKINIDPKKRHQ